MTHLPLVNPGAVHLWSPSQYHSPSAPLGCLHHTVLGSDSLTWNDICRHVVFKGEIGESGLRLSDAGRECPGPEDGSGVVGILGLSSKSFLADRDAKCYLRHRIEI